MYFIVLYFDVLFIERNSFPTMALAQTLSKYLIKSGLPTGSQK